MPQKKSKPKIGGMSITQECDHYRNILPKAIHEPGTPATLVIDGMNIAHMAYHAYGKLSYQGKSVSMLFGVPQIIRTLIAQHKPTKVIVCWDGMKSKRRMKWLPGYKEHRLTKRDPVVREKFEKQLNKVRYMLYLMGIPQVHNPKVEGDDMVYLISKKESFFNPVIIISGDKDMLQMVNWDITVINPRNKTIHSAYNFSLGAPYVRIDQVVDYISMVGDSSDDIPGIKGIGESKSTQFLQKWHSWKAYMEDEDGVFPGLMDKDKANKVMKLNRKMIDIIWYCNRFHKKPKWITYYKDKPFPSFNEDKYITLCQKYNLKTMLTETFKKTFRNI